MYLCYLDESGIDGKSRVVTVVGIVVDGSRHGRSTDVFQRYFKQGVQEARGGMREFKGADLYQGNAKWRGVSASVREGLVADIVGFAAARKHRVVLGSIDLDLLESKPSPLGDTLDARNLCALHCLIQLQRHQSRKQKRKGSTLVLLDEQRGNERLVELVMDPPQLVRDFVAPADDRDPFSAIVDAPLSVRSDQFGMTQIADVNAFIVGRFARLESGEQSAFDGEPQRMQELVARLSDQLLPESVALPKRGAGELAAWYRDVMPPPVRALFGS